MVLQNCWDARPFFEDVLLSGDRSTQAQWLTKKLGPGNLYSQTESYIQKQFYLAPVILSILWKSGKYLMKKSFLSIPLTGAKLVLNKALLLTELDCALPRWNLMVSTRLLHLSMLHSWERQELYLISPAQGCSYFHSQFYPLTSLLCVWCAWAFQRSSFILVSHSEKLQIGELKIPLLEDGYGHLPKDEILPCGDKCQSY